MKVCRTCKGDFNPSPHESRKKDFLCRDCRNAYNRAWVAKRKAEGRPVRTGKMTREYYRAYALEYIERDGVRESLAARARRLRLDPIERYKAASRRVVRREIGAGRMVRGPCEVCSEFPTDAHHDDYDKPLEVRWLCRTHHNAHHRRQRAEETP